MSAVERYEEILAAKGVSLDRLGLQELALRRSDALDAIQVLRDLSIPVLGGDVYLERAGGVELGYANWHVERQSREEAGQFAERSCIKAESYVMAFPRRAEETPLFVLVISSE
jgi:hypothetical protein